MKSQQEEPRTIHFCLKYNLKRKPVKQSYFLQDIEAVFEQLINDSLNCEALAGLQFLCGRYSMRKRIGKEVLLELVRIKNGSQRPGDQCLSINILTAVIFESNNIRAVDIMQDFSQTQDYDGSFFKGMTDKLSSFLADGDNLNTMAKLEVIFSLTDAIGTFNLEEWMSEGQVLVTETLTIKRVCLNYRQGVRQTFEELLTFAKQLKNVNWYDMRTYSQWVFKEISDNECQHILLEDGIFANILQAFERYPAIISKAMRQLARNKNYLSTLLQNSWRDIIAFFNRMLPDSKFEVIQAVLEMATLVLQANEQYCHLVWQCDRLMECLRLAVHLPKESIPVQAFQVFRLLIINGQYGEVAWRIEDNKVASVIVKAFKVKYRNELISSKRVIQEGLKVISKIMEFEKYMIKFSRIQNAVFTQNLRESGLGFILEEIYCRFDGHIKAMTIAILSQSFVKIEGEISSISFIAQRQKLFDDQFSLIK